MHLVLIETAGNQAYIFATNKLRENVGASELTARAGTQFVLDAVAEQGGPRLRDGTAGKIRAALKDATRNRPVDDSNPVEVLLAVSGKALLLVRNEEIGRRIVSAVTLRALDEAPGLEIRGVIGEPIDLAAHCLHGEISKVHKRFDGVKSRLPTATARFLRLPLVAECATSGLPAKCHAGLKQGLAPGEEGPRSAQSLAKADAQNDWRVRLDQLLAAHNSSAALPLSTTAVEELGCDWQAVVHADGNGLGEVFLKFDTKVTSKAAPDSERKAEFNRDYITQLRRFSIALDECTEQAFCEALNVLKPKLHTTTRGERRMLTPIVPLVLGGDDLTVVCDGRQALRFTKRFIECFEDATKRHEDILPILPDGVTICAGIAVVKPHFPFFAAYELAEALLKSAKKLKPRSAIDFHVLYDASGPDLERLRRETMTDQGETCLVARPYTVRRDESLPGRSWDDLQSRIEAVRDVSDDGRRVLPNGLLHDLREGLFHGREVAEARLRLVLDRYPGLRPLLCANKLFWTEGKPEIHRTGLLDAVDVAEFWEGQP